MKIRVTYIAEISDIELADAGIDKNDLDAVADYFYDMGGENEFHSYGEGFERAD